MILVTLDYLYWLPNFLYYLKSLGFLLSYEFQYVSFILAYIYDLINTII